MVFTMPYGNRRRQRNHGCSSRRRYGPAGCDNLPRRRQRLEALQSAGCFDSLQHAMGGTDFNQVETRPPTGTPMGRPMCILRQRDISRKSVERSCAGQTGGVNACVSATAASGALNIAAGSGGPSAVYTKPIWQTGTGVPTDGARDIPDVSLFLATVDSREAARVFMSLRI